MTETDEERTGVESTVEDAETDEPADVTGEVRDATAADADTADERTTIDYVHWGLLAILLLVTLVATFRFYFAVSDAITNFVSREFRPLFQAGFNLAILLACGAGLSVLVRRIR